MWQRLKYQLARFSAGRYGNDRLNMALVILGIVLLLLGMILRLGILVWLAYLPILYSCFRSLSRNGSARRREGAWFESLLPRLRDRKNRYFSCPKCRQVVRVPKGKGKISIRCPKCGERFIKKT